MDAGSLARLAAEFRPADVSGRREWIVEPNRPAMLSDRRATNRRRDAGQPAITGCGDMFCEAVADGAEIGSTLRLRPANGSVVALAWLLPPRENGKYFLAPDRLIMRQRLAGRASRSARLSSLRSEAGVGPVWMNGNWMCAFSTREMIFSASSNRPCSIALCASRSIRSASSRVIGFWMVGRAPIATFRRNWRGFPRGVHSRRQATPLAQGDQQDGSHVCRSQLASPSSAGPQGDNTCALFGRNRPPGQCVGVVRLPVAETRRVRD